MVNATALEIYDDYYVWVPGVGGHDWLSLAVLCGVYRIKSLPITSALNLDLNNTQVSAA